MALTMMRKSSQAAARLLGGAGVRNMSFDKKAGWWTYVHMAPPDSTLGITDLFNKDPDSSKLNLCVGSYRNDEGNPIVLECVRKAEDIVYANRGGLDYLPMFGSQTFIDHAIKLAYGEDSELIKDNRIAAVQTLSGTGACRLMAEYQRKFENKVYMFIPYPTWPNHHNIWKDSQVRSQTYRYYDSETKGLAFTGLMADAKNAQDGSFFLLHACAHNPTGVDPTVEQWKELSALMKTKGHFPFFDLAYQGFASGDLEKDAQAIRIFVEDGHEIAVAQSFAKNMGLYGERVGCLSLITGAERQTIAVKSQLQQILRPIYSSPPIHGAALVSTVLGDPELKTLWYKEVKEMADRIRSMRVQLREKIENLGSEYNWKHLTDQIGMFAYSGLTPSQVVRMIDLHHMYLPKNGRLSFANINSGNIDRVAHALHEVTAHVQIIPEGHQLDPSGRVVPIPTNIQPPARRRIKWNGGDWRRS